MGLEVTGKIEGELVGSDVGTLLGEVVGCNIEKIYDACM